MSDHLDFRRGDCAVLALRLAELTGHPLVALVRDGEFHHVAVQLSTGRVLDADGVGAKSRVAQKYGGGVWVPVTEEQLAAAGLPTWNGYDDEELDVVDALAEALAEDAED